MKFARVQAADPAPEDLPALYRTIEGFVKAGGVVTISEWMDMHPVERAILIEIRNGGPGREKDVLKQLADDIASRVASEPVGVSGT